MSPSRRKTHGFTLVELMVVIALIALLAGILFPVLAKARTKAYQAVCISNQRQLALSIIIDASDRQEHFADTKSVWSSIDPPPRMLLCPAAGKKFINSYSYNGNVAGKSTTNLPDPAGTILTVDGLGDIPTAYSVADCAMRHQERFFASYADGHAGWGVWGQGIDGEELGQPLEGLGCANFAWLRYPGVKFGIKFQAPKSGTITKLTMHWMRTYPGYGSGTYGLYHVELQTNGPGNFPSGNALAVAGPLVPEAAMDYYGDGAFFVPMTATLTKGETYHVVVTNVDPDPASNWCSPSILMSRLLPWDDSFDRSEVFIHGGWKPWTTIDIANIFNPEHESYVNGMHAATMLTWSDGTNTGSPYYSAFNDALLYDQRRLGEHILWTQPPVTLRQLGVSAWAIGTPGALRFHLEEVGGRILAEGTIATAAEVGRTPTWVYHPVQGATLHPGNSYRLWFDSPTSTSSSDCYRLSAIYADNRPAEWLQGSWGGTQSCLIRSNGGAWDRYEPSDLSFSLK